MEILNEDASPNGSILHRLAAYISWQIAECEKCNKREFTFLAVSGHDFALKRVYNVLEEFHIPESWLEDVSNLIHCSCCGRSLRMDHRIVVNAVDGMENVFGSS